MVYDIENRADAPCTLTVRPVCLFAPKGQTAEAAPAWSGCALHCNDIDLPVSTNGTVLPTPPVWERPAYPDDARDGRIAEGRAAAREVDEYLMGYSGLN